MKELNVTIVSGCLALQNKLDHGGVNEESLYHQIVKKTMQKYGVNLNIKIVHYERFSDCLDRINNSLIEYPADLILFQVRGHHYLRLVNLFGKYYNDLNKEWKWNINLPFIKVNNHERFAPEIGYKNLKKVKKSKNFFRRAFIKGFLKNINCLVGALIGNENTARKSYRRLIEGIINLSKTSNTQVIFIGVVSRPGCSMEDYYSKKLNLYFQDYLAKASLPYIDIFGKYDEDNIYKFDTDNLHLNAAGHKEIARKLLPELKNFLPEVKKEVLINE